MHLNQGASYGKGGENHMRMNIGTSRKLVELALTNMANATRNIYQFVGRLLSRPTKTPRSHEGTKPLYQRDFVPFVFSWLLLGTRWG